MKFFTLLLGLLILTNGLYSQSEKSERTFPDNIFRIVDKDSSKLEWFPIFNYDSELGFGYGVKTFWLNPLGYNESFDLLLFASTKGERWARFVFSIPDFELRQGKKYDISADLVIDYDLIKKIRFFGIGNNSLYENDVEYTKIPANVKLVLGRGFSREIVAQVKFNYNRIVNHGLDVQSIYPGYTKVAENLITGILLRYDKRDSYINPKSGYYLSFEYDYSPKILENGVEFDKRILDIANYVTIWNVVIAARLKYENINGDVLPLQIFPTLGGTWSLRGYPQERFIGDETVLFNSELRFPLPWNFGAVAGFDAGKIIEENENTIDNWKYNWTAGLRYYFKTFILRFDLGFSNEYTVFFFNIGHVF